MTVQQLIFHIAKCVTENRTNNINRELPEKVTLKLPFSHQNNPKSNLFHPQNR